MQGRAAAKTMFVHGFLWLHREFKGFKGSIPLPPPPLPTFALPSKKWAQEPLFYKILVWTLCLMHRCVCIWRYILQNYNYKLHFQNLSTYHIPHVSIGTLAAENLDVCTACDLWDSNIQLTMVKDQRPWLGMPFLDSNTCAEGGLFISARVFFHVWCYPWMDDGTHRWMEKASQPRHPLLYVIVFGQHRWKHRQECERRWKERDSRSM